jgi:hypothetical protein
MLHKFEGGGRRRKLLSLLYGFRPRIRPQERELDNVLRLYEGGGGGGGESTKKTKREKRKVGNLNKIL